MARVFLGLGSNLGDRRAQLSRALRALREVVTVAAVSSVYDSAPFGYTAQARFLNVVCLGETRFAPEELLRQLKRLERDVGRQASRRWGPRAIDIDILLYDDLRMASPDLTIPHEGLAQRAFVLAPLAELCPELTPPGRDHTVSQLLAELGPQDVQRLEGDEGRLP